MPSLHFPPTKKGLRKLSKDVVDTVENLDTKQLIAPTRTSTKLRVRNRKHSKRKATVQRALQRQRTFRYVQNQMF